MLSRRADASATSIASPAGKVKGYYDDFLNCEVHQHRSAHGTVTLDQDERIDALISIGHVVLVKTKADGP
eukprot:4469166-Pyramimonas_sp.AAC.1